MKKYIILVEGIADLIFLRDFFDYAIEETLEVVFEKADKNDKNSAKLKITNNINIKIDVLITGGYTTISKSLKTRLKELIDFDNELILIFDADDPSKPDGGVENRRKYLENIAALNGIKFKTFLFPNNRDDGDLETLLVNTVNEIRYSRFHTNYNTYANSISTFSSIQFCEELLSRKQLVYNYFQVYYGMDNAREENRRYEKEFWEYNHCYLEPLKSFLRSILL